MAGNITGIALSNAFFPAGLSGSTLIGKITVLTTGATFTGKLVLSGAHASLFQLIGTMLNTALDGLANGIYTVNITPTQAGFVGSGTAFAFVIIGGKTLLDKSGNPVRAKDGSYVAVV